MRGMADDEIEIPPVCFDTQGRIACFLCAGDLWPQILVPPTRDAESVLDAWKQHAVELGHDPERPVLAMQTQPIHAWAWPT